MPAAAGHLSTAPHSRAPRLRAPGLAVALEVALIASLLEAIAAWTPGRTLFRPRELVRDEDHRLAPRRALTVPVICAVMAAGGWAAYQQAAP